MWGEKVYRILITDDEAKIIQLILSLGHWEELGIEIVATCNDGEEAFQRIQELQPDIVITDIKMPVYDGIQLIEKTKESGTDTHFIVLSGFKYFEYARNAIQLGVVDYLLKPLDEEQLNKTLKKTCSLIDAKRKVLTEQQQLTNYLSCDQARMQMRLLTDLEESIFNNDVFLHTLYTCNQEYKTNFSYPFFRCIYLTTNLENLLGGNESLFSEKIQESLQNLFSEQYCYAYFPKEDGAVLLLNFQCSQRSNVKQAISALYYRLKCLTEIYGDFTLNIGVSMEKEDISLLPTAVKEAFIAEWGRIVLMGDKVLEYDLIKSLPRFSITDIMPPHLERELVECVKTFQREKIGRIFSQIASGAACRNEYYPGDIWNFLSYLEKELFSIHIENEDKNKIAIREDALSVQYKNAKGFRECVKMLYLQLDEWLDLKLKNLKENMDKPINEAKKYVDCHFCEPLSLELLAERVCLSPTYFSKLFKLETGTCFSDYLIQIRIDKAKELLIRTSNTIKEISLKVGYQDDKHFSKQFKKQVGVKPSEFKKLYGN